MKSRRHQKIIHRTKFKLGLALSGGGFRASLFHLGVLARLAERDLLSSVEVISTVSGGSIIGALYYLHLKKLLESIPDKKISSNAYVGLVREIERSFVPAIQRNLRVRAYSSFRKNWRMIYDRSYSRSDRMAELYDEFFYDAAALQQRIPLNRLRIQPPGAPDNFHPHRHNRTRRHKVPILLINATTLNTGRNWQFTAVDAGERESDLMRDRSRSDRVDKNAILSVFRYDDDGIPSKYRSIPLSIAVAASACVPGIFAPLPLTGLYTNVTPKLVDGGLYDNQGISGLISEECTMIIASDASGLLPDERVSSSGLVGVLGRSNGVLMDRNRDAGFTLLESMQQNGSITRYAVLHLQHELGVERLSPHGVMTEPSKRMPAQTSYGMNGEAQIYLSNLRTDLDCFSDTEAYSLIYSGYAMAETAIPASWSSRVERDSTGIRGAKHDSNTKWMFEAVRDSASAETLDSAYRKLLRIGAMRLLKTYRMAPWMIPVGVFIAALGLAIPLALVAALWFLVPGGSIVLGLLAATSLLALIVAPYIGSSYVRNIGEDFFLRYVVSSVVALSGFLIAKLHLLLVDPVFLRKGRLDKK